MINMPTGDKNPILLVEDSEDDAFFFTRTLERSGSVCSVRHVANGMQAIQYLHSVARRGNENLPRVVFLDLKMPIMNGFEVLDWMQTQTFPPEMHVIVLSGSEHSEDKDRAARMGAMDYLVKPINAKDFHRLLPKVCWDDPEMGARS